MKYFFSDSYGLGEANSTKYIKLDIYYFADVILKYHTYLDVSLIDFLCKNFILLNHIILTFFFSKCWRTCESVYGSILDQFHGSHLLYSICNYQIYKRANS